MKKTQPPPPLVTLHSFFPKRKDHPKEKPNVQHSSLGMERQEMSELALLHAGVIAAPLASHVPVQRSPWVADTCLEIADEELDRVKKYYALQQREVQLTRTLTDMIQVIPLLSIPNGDFSSIPGKGFCGWLVMLKMLHPALSLDLLERLTRTMLFAT
jgi:hypothetical protein